MIAKYMTPRNTWISQKGERESSRLIQARRLQTSASAAPTSLFWCLLHTLIERLRTACFFSRERQRGSHDLTFPAFAVCRRGGHFSRLEETRKREYLQLVCTDYCFIFIVYFCSYASRFGFPCVQVSFGICETTESWKIYNLDPEASESCQNFNISNGLFFTAIRWPWIIPYFHWRKLHC